MPFNVVQVQSTSSNPVWISMTGTIDAVFSGTQSVIFASGSTASVTNVTVSGTSVSILAANANRLAATIQNTTAQASIFYVKMGTGASSTSMTVRMGQNSYYEVPGRYTGIIHAIASGAGAISTGTLGVTEITA